MIALLKNQYHKNLFFSQAYPKMRALPGVLSALIRGSACFFACVAMLPHLARFSWDSQRYSTGPLVMATWTFQHKICSTDLQFTDPEAPQMKVRLLILYITLSQFLSC